ncbi:MAG: hypothetical protein R3A44_16035 [Caldilineaceae bacterium]
MMQAKARDGVWRRPIPYLYKALLLFYVGLYAFVLPFICWGAQATPGHPHANAHFVFVDPATTTELQAHPLHHHAANVDPCHAPSSYTTPSEPGKSPAAPAGRSVPPQLAIGSLLPIETVMTVIPANVADGDFPRWLTPLSWATFSPRIPTPPPRL